MKKISKLLGIFLFLIIGIYETSNIVENLQEKDEIMIKIKESNSKYVIKPVNAEIKDNEIIPGIYGTEIDYKKSYNNMKKYGTYNESLTVLKDNKPSISIDNSYDKYISKGNSNNRNVSLVFIIEEESQLQQLLNFLKTKNINITIFIDGSIIENNINAIKELKKQELEILSYKSSYDEVFLKTSFSYLETITNKKVKYCYTEKENSELLKICSKEKMHTIKPKIIIKNNLLKNVKDSLENSIIFAIEKYEYNDLLLAIEYIKSKGYNIVTLDCLLSEKVC